jgi:hypothetical protein
MSPAELLNANGIYLPSYKPGRYYITCPQCSHTRSDKKAKVLGVTIEGDSARWGCNHCPWTGPEKGNGKANGHDHSPAATHDYTWDGTLLFQKVRNPPGSRARFYCRRPNGSGGWIDDLEGIDRKPLYRWPEVEEAVAKDLEIAIVEGESDANALWAIGIPATCNFDGAADVTKKPDARPKWKPEYSQLLAGARLVVFNDHDDPGYAHAEAVCLMSAGVAKRVRKLELAKHWPEITKGGDVRDWLAAGHTREQLDALIEQAPDYTKQEPPPPDPPPRAEDAGPPPIIKTSAEFIAGFVPPDYILDGLLQQSFLYSLTGATGAGKTSITLRLAASTALGRVFAGRETKKCRVLYMAAENPDDTRMRWIGLAPHEGFDPNTIEVFFSDQRFTISKMLPMLKAELARHGGEFGLVIIDTGPSFFEGDDENSRAQMGAHARMLRSLIDIIPGRPCIIVNCHPTKTASADNLLPAGGGSFLNEMDGNLTASKTESTVEMHWQGKYRGPDFAPMFFLIKTVTHQDLKDKKGKLIPTCIAESISEQAKEEIAKYKADDENRVLEIINLDPKISNPNIATAMGWKLHNGEPDRKKAQRCVKILIKDKLIKETRTGRYQITPEGKKALKGETDEEDQDAA